ncbi:cinnamoyl-Coa reductase [Ancistrocladus abbreviatus]
MGSETPEGNCLAWAAKDTSGVLSPFKFSRRAVGSDDISVKITHCGICYGDVMWSRNLFAGLTKYPLVPGHEISGIVQEVGANVTRWKVGDRVGVASYVNSCRNCEMCDQYMEYHCVKGRTLIHNGIDVDGSITRGGYSTFVVVHERYVFRIPDNYPADLAAPLLCAGICVYAPMVQHNMTKPGRKLGVIGLGGLGHLAVIFGKFWGLEVTVFSTSPWKKDSALNELKADRFVLSSDEEQMKSMVKSLDCIIDCASEDHPLDPYIVCLKATGVFVVTGAPPEMKFNPLHIILGKTTIAGYAVDGTKITQEMLDFCAENKIYPIIETIPIQKAYEAHEKIIKKEVKYRFVIDIENSLK